MKRSHIILGVFAAFVLSFGLLAAGPGTAQAQAAEKPLTASSSIVGELQTQAKMYPIWVGYQRVTSANKGNVLGDKKKSVRYNPSTNTLTLNNATIKNAHITTSSNYTYYTGIDSRSAKSLTIVLKGKNTITVPGKATAGSYGITSSYNGEAKNVLIKGSGSLKVKAGEADYYSKAIHCQNLNISGSVQVTACGGVSTYSGKLSNDAMAGSYGVDAMGFLALGGSAKLIATGKTKALSRAATYAQSYTPLVKAGSSSKSIKVNKKNPAKSVYTKYKYVSIAKATSSSSPSSSTSSKTPAKTSITSIDTSKAGQATINWLTVSKNCTGYEIQISATSSFDSSKGYVYSKRYYSGYANLSSATFTLNPAGIWYFRVRPLNHVSDSKEYKGAWSAYVPAYVGSSGAAG